MLNINIDRFKNVFKKFQGFNINKFILGASFVLLLIIFIVTSNVNSLINNTINIDDIVNISAQLENVYVRSKFGMTKIPGKWFSDLLANNKDEFKEISPTPRSNNFIIYFGIDSEYKVEIYSSSSIIKIVYGNNYQYYDVPPDLYDHINLKNAVSNYKIPLDTIIPIFDGVRIKAQSNNFRPEEKELKTVISICDYYIYSKNGKYYADIPGEFINEITEEQYNKALNYTFYR